MSDTNFTRTAERETMWKQRGLFAAAAALVAAVVAKVRGEVRLAHSSAHEKVADLALVRERIPLCFISPLCRYPRLR
jgi:hypothetical protein